MVLWNDWNVLLVICLIWLVYYAGMGMLLWWRTLKEGGGNLYSKGYVLFLVLEFECFLIY
jgi:hypothetical protein